MFVDELVESILASIQWDRWRFLIPTAKPLLRQDVAVVSHSHMDHWHPNFYHKDLILVPWELRTPEQHSILSNILRVHHSQSIGKMRFSCINGWALRHYLHYPFPDPHATWWIASSLGARVLFIGDVNATDIETARRFIEMRFADDRPLQGVILPSFGGVLKHGSKHALEIPSKITKLAYYIRDKLGVKVGAIPHPVSAEWADYNAVRL